MLSVLPTELRKSENRSSYQSTVTASDRVERPSDVIDRYAFNLKKDQLIDLKQSYLEGSEGCPFTLRVEEQQSTDDSTMPPARSFQQSQ
jgi:hypothetical protein